MDSHITGFHQDSNGHWVAELECGHQQHVRHDPPWQLRPWVLEKASREERVGTLLACSFCDSVKYEDSRIQGLCHDGASEVTKVRKTEGC